MARILNISGAEITDKGIQKLAEYVEAHLPDDFTLVIGCKPFVYDVDGVLIGRGNIYAIECKDWKGNIRGGTYGWWQKDGQVIENPLQQARNNAAALGKWLRSKLPSCKKIWVKGLLVFTNDEVEGLLDDDKDSLKGLSVMHLDEFDEFIDNDKGSVSANSIKEANGLFTSLCPKNSKSKLSLMEKILTFFSVSLFIATIVSGYMFSKNTSSYAGSYLILCGFSFVAVTFFLIFYNADFRGIGIGDDKTEPAFRDEYDPHTDLVADPLNIFNTYKKP